MNNYDLAIVPHLSSFLSRKSELLSIVKESRNPRGVFYVFSNLVQYSIARCNFTNKADECGGALSIVKSFCSERCDILDLILSSDKAQDRRQALSIRNSRI